MGVCHGAMELIWPSGELIEPLWNLVFVCKNEPTFVGSYCIYQVNLILTIKEKKFGSQFAVNIVIYS